jgi:hypothetical protein
MRARNTSFTGPAVPTHAVRSAGGTHATNSRQNGAMNGSRTPAGTGGRAGPTAAASTTTMEPSLTSDIHTGMSIDTANCCSGSRSSRCKGAACRQILAMAGPKEYRPLCASRDAHPQAHNVCKIACPVDRLMRRSRLISASASRASGLLASSSTTATTRRVGGDRS